MIEMILVIIWFKIYNSRIHEFAIYLNLYTYIFLSLRLSTIK